MSSLFIGFVAGLGASSLLKNHFGLLAVIVLGIVGILVSRALSALLNRDGLNEPRRTRIKKHVPQIASGWNYRPREAAARFAAADIPGTDAADGLNPMRWAVNEHSNPWSNDDSFEPVFYTFANPDPTSEDMTTTAPRPDHEAAISAYD